MASYKQVYSFKEDFWGEITITFMVSDVYNELFQTCNNTINFIELEEINKEISNEYGLVEHELTLNINESAIKTNTDKDAFNLIKRARDPNELIYCALFIDTSDPPDPNDTDFVGLVQSEWEAEDLLWHGGQYESNPAPVRKWKLRARPVSNAVLDKITLKELIEGANDVPGIDDAWISQNVFDKQGYHYFQTQQYIINTQWRNLVSFDKLLRKLADNLTQGLQNRFGITLNIVFDRFQIDGKFYPARWIRDNNLLTQGFLAFEPAKFFFDEGRDLVIDPDASNNPDEFYISFQNIKLYKDYELNPERAKGMLWSERIKTFNEFIYRLAENFGAFPIFEFDNSQTLRINFVSKTSVMQSSFIYIRGAKESKLKGVATEKIKADYYGRGFYYCWEGLDYYGKFGNIKPEKEKNFRLVYILNDEPQGNKNKELLLTISATTCEIYLLDSFWYGQRSYMFLPHNIYFLLNTESQNIWTLNHYSQHSAIYVKVFKRNDHYPEFEPPFYYTPIGWFKIKKPDNTELSVDKLSDYLNFLANLNKDEYFLNYELDVPFYYGFSNNQDGSNPSWKILKIGKKIELDNVTYVIEGIKRKLTEPLVTLKLQAFSKYDFDNNVSTSGTLTPSTLPKEEIQGDLETYIAGENIVKFNYVTLRDDGKVINSNESISHRSRYIGIALNEASAGETVTVQRSGIVRNEDWNFTPGAKIFIKTAQAYPYNLSEIPNTSPMTGQEMYVVVAVAEPDHIIRILNPPEEYTMLG